MNARSSNCSISAKFFPMLLETPYFGGVINTKTYLNHELGSKFGFLNSLAYKLVNLLVKKKIMQKEQIYFLFFIIGLELNFTYEFEVCFTQTTKITQTIPIQNKLTNGSNHKKKLVSFVCIFFRIRGTGGGALWADIRGYPQMKIFCYFVIITLQKYTFK